MDAQPALQNATLNSKALFVILFMPGHKSGLEFVINKQTL
jgi:hypothetical protein